MLTALAEDPENRELKPFGSGHYTAVWFRGMRARPEVAFVSPRTRTLAATLELSSKTAPVILPAELIPSGQHDPLLKGLQRRPAGLHEVVLSSQDFSHGPSRLCWRQRFEPLLSDPQDLPRPNYPSSTARPFRPYTAVMCGSRMDSKVRRHQSDL